MVKPEIIKETPMSMADLKEEINKRKKETKDLHFRAEKTEEYLNQFTILDKKKANELKEKLEKLKIPRLKDVHIIKMVDLMPKTPEDVKSILSGYTITITADNLKKIAEAVKGFK